MAGTITISILNDILLKWAGVSIILEERREEMGSVKGGNMNQAVKGISKADDYREDLRQWDHLKRQKGTNILHGMHFLKWDYNKAFKNGYIHLPLICK